MAAESGVNVLLKVGDGGSPTLFTTVAGQQNTVFDGTTETADITDKANAGWGSTISTLIRGTIQCSGVAVWPDTAGLDQVRTSWQARTTLEAEITFSIAGAKYFGFFYITAFQISGTHTGATEYSFTMETAEPLTYAAT